MSGILFILIIVMLLIFTYYFSKLSMQPTIIHYTQGPGLGQTQQITPFDVIQDYDYRKAFDPLEQPVQRVDRHQIPPLHVKNMIDYFILV